MTTGAPTGYNSVMIHNYDLEMQKIVENLPVRPRLLLHCCCGPCATACIERLQPHFRITAYYYNPNIMPAEEYWRRSQALAQVCDYFGVPLISEEYRNGVFLDAVGGMEKEGEGGVRCGVCFKLRLAATALRAQKDDYDFFSTTLTVSPHKNSETVNRTGFAAAESVKPSYLPADFKKRGGYLRSLQLSAELALYRQNYCGCRL